MFKSQFHLTVIEAGVWCHEIWFNPPFLWKCCTKSGPLRFSQFSGCWLILSCLLTCEFCLSLWKIAQCSVILLLPLFPAVDYIFKFLFLYFNAAHFNYSRDAANYTNFNVFDMTQAGIEATIYHILGEHVNHYTTEATRAVLNRRILIMFFKFLTIFCCYYHFRYNKKCRVLQSPWMKWRKLKCQNRNQLVK